MLPSRTISVVLAVLFLTGLTMGVAHAHDGDGHPAGLDSDDHHHRHHHHDHDGNGGGPQGTGHGEPDGDEAGGPVIGAPEPPVWLMLGALGVMVGLGMRLRNRSANA